MPDHRFTGSQRRLSKAVMVAGAMAALIACAWPLQALAQSTGYPSRSVKVIVPFPPGASTNDILGRLISARLSESTGQPFVVENRAGAGGTIGTEMGAKATADGYTLLIGTNGPIAIGPHVYRKLGYDPLKDLQPVTLFAMVPYAIIVNPSLPANNLSELIALAKASPGRLNYASSGNGSPAHLCGELLRGQTGIDITHVPYKGGAPAANDLIAGQVQIYCPGLSSVIPLVRAGKLRALAITMPQRTPFLPEVSTSAEQGLPGLSVNSWVGLMAPAGVPQAVVDRLHREISRWVTEPEVRAAIEKNGAEPVAIGPAAFADFLAAESAKWREVVVRAKLTLD
jgi:tripartite-type tricarboxylate transporter receptor subunit TctC